jgi:hypothetical protein
MSEDLVAHRALFETIAPIIQKKGESFATHLVHRVYEQAKYHPGFSSAKFDCEAAMIYYKHFKMYDTEHAKSFTKKYAMSIIRYNAAWHSAVLETLKKIIEKENL